MVRRFMLFFSIYFLGFCGPIAKAEDYDGLSKTSDTFFMLFLLSTLNEMNTRKYLNGVPANDYQFKFSVYDQTKKLLNADNYCVNVYVTTLTNANVITGWESFTKSIYQCSPDYSTQSRCLVTTSTTYINEIVFPSTIQRTEQKRICREDLQGVVLN